MPRKQYFSVALSLLLLLQSGSIFAEHPSYQATLATQITPSLNVEDFQAETTPWQVSIDPTDFENPRTTLNSIASDLDAFFSLHSPSEILHNDSDELELRLYAYGLIPDEARTSEDDAKALEVARTLNSLISQFDGLNEVRNLFFDYLFTTSSLYLKTYLLMQLLLISQQFSNFVAPDTFASIKRDIMEKATFVPSHDGTEYANLDLHFDFEATTEFPSSRFFLARLSHEIAHHMMLPYQESNAYFRVRAFHELFAHLMEIFIYEVNGWEDDEFYQTFQEWYPNLTPPGKTLNLGEAAWKPHPAAVSILFRTRDYQRSFKNHPLRRDISFGNFLILMMHYIRYFEPVFRDREGDQQYHFVRVQSGFLWLVDRVILGHQRAEDLLASLQDSNTFQRIVRINRANINPNGLVTRVLPGERHLTFLRSA